MDSDGRSVSEVVSRIRCNLLFAYHDIYVRRSQRSINLVVAPNSVDSEWEDDGLINSLPAFLLVLKVA